MKIYDERLLILADRLLEIGEDNKMEHKEFDFNYYHRSINSCGYARCALGECGYLFPEWHFNEANDPVLIKRSYPSHTIDSAMVFFNLNHDNALHLFYPNSQKYNCEKLGSKATSEAVAYNIIDFVEMRMKKFLVSGAY